MSLIVKENAKRIEELSLKARSIALMVSMLDSSPNVTDSLLNELLTINIQITAFIEDSLKFQGEGVPF